MLMVDGTEKVGANLRHIMEKSRTLEEAVIFIDEFEEIAGSRDEASAVDKSITNEFLKQVAAPQKQGNKVLFICATDYIRELDAALLRPGRFDCIIPGGRFKRRREVHHPAYYLSKLNTGEVDLDRIIKMTNRFTPADLNISSSRWLSSPLNRNWLRSKIIG